MATRFDPTGTVVEISDLAGAIESAVAKLRDLMTELDIHLMDGGELPAQWKPLTASYEFDFGSDDERTPVPSYDFDFGSEPTPVVDDYADNIGYPW